MLCSRLGRAQSAFLCPRPGPRPLRLDCSTGRLPAPRFRGGGTDAGTAEAGPLPWAAPVAFPTPEQVSSSLHPPFQLTLFCLPCSAGPLC